MTRPSLWICLAAAGCASDPWIGSLALWDVEQEEVAPPPDAEMTTCGRRYPQAGAWHIDRRHGHYVLASTMGTEQGRLEATLDALEWTQAFVEIAVPDEGIYFRRVSSRITVNADGTGDRWSLVEEGFSEEEINYYCERFVELEWAWIDRYP